MTALPMTPQTILAAYLRGWFPMADGRDGEVNWYCPQTRALLPLEAGAFKIPRSLAKRVRSRRYTITLDATFEGVIRACGEPRPYTHDTWINEEVIQAYTALHRAEKAHSVEAWDTNNKLVGGLYGVTMGGAFFGESMFNRATDASKVCLVHLVEHLRQRGFVLLDAQMHNDHLEQFGLMEVPLEEYLEKLEDASLMDVSWG